MVDVQVVSNLMDVCDLGNYITNIFIHTSQQQHGLFIYLPCA